MKTLDILTIGEPLVEFAEVARQGERVFVPGFGGDASNVAIAAARSGARAAILTAVGDDPFGREFLALWDGEQIDRSDVIVRKQAPTGLYFISYGDEGHAFSYRRAGSAASLLCSDEIPRERVASARVLHSSGIGLAISTSSADAVLAAIAHARECGTLVAFDPNLRLRLWPLERARALIHAAMASADIALPGLEDARLLTGLREPEAICDFYLRLGCRVVALTLGREGALVATPTERRAIAAYPVQAVDATGAGDTFDGAFLADYVTHGDPFAAAVYANAAAALSTLGRGAVAPIPDRAAVERFLSQRP